MAMTIYNKNVENRKRKIKMSIRNSISAGKTEAILNEKYKTNPKKRVVGKTLRTKPRKKIHQTCNLKLSHENIPNSTNKLKTNF